MRAAIFFISILAFFSLHSLSAGEYLISPFGNDQDSGTKEAPLASVARGFEKLRGELGKGGYALAGGWRACDSRNVGFGDEG